MKVLISESQLRRLLGEDEDNLPELEDYSATVEGQDNVTCIQKALQKEGLGDLLGNTGPNSDGVDGKFGPKTKKAVIKYQIKFGIRPTGFVGEKTSAKMGCKSMQSTSKTQKTGTDKVKQKTSDEKKPVEKTSTTKGKNYMMVIAFPDYEPKPNKGEKVTNFEKIAISVATGEWPREGTYGKLGHAGAVLIKNDGDVKLFEFGRYNTPTGKGIVKSKYLGKIAKFNSKGDLIDETELAKKVKKKTEGEGPFLNMITALLPLPKYDEAFQFASRGGLRDYVLRDETQGGPANCGTFAIDVAKNGGVNIGSWCEPMPNKMIQKFKPFSLKYFTV